MSYDRDEAMRQQEATETMIRMREPQGALHPDPMAADQFAYSQDVITRLHERAESYRQSSPSAAHTADLLDEAAGAIAALIERVRT